MEEVRQQQINEFMSITGCEDAGMALEIISITSNLEVDLTGCHSYIL